MSTASLATRPAVLPPEQGRAGLPGALASEWTKIRSVRSTVWILLILIIATAGINVLSGYAWAHNAQQNLTAPPGADFRPPPIVLDTKNLQIGIFFGQLIAIVLGGLGIASEYSTGMIRTTLSVQPRRGTVFLAKLLVLTGVSLVIGEVISFGSFFLTNSLIHTFGIHFSLSNSDTLVGVIGGGLYLTGCALLAFGVGALFRNTATAIAVPVALLLVVDILVHAALPESLQQHVTPYVPMEAGPQILSNVHQPGTDLTAWHGFGVFMIYVVISLAAGFWAFTERDA